MGTLPARFVPNQPIGILQIICTISSPASVHLEKLPQFGRSKDFNNARAVAFKTLTRHSRESSGMASRCLETGEQGSLHQTSKIDGMFRADCAGDCFHRLIPLANSCRPEAFQLEEQSIIRI
jgi:hypothetical protein